jgi:hypothetical protein
MGLFRQVEKKNSPLPLGRIARVHVDREIGVTVFTRTENRIVKFGFGRYREKLATFGQLDDMVRRDRRLARYRVVDLNDLHRIVFTPQPTGSAESDRKEV